MKPLNSLMKSNQSLAVLLKRKLKPNGSVKSLSLLVLMAEAGVKSENRQRKSSGFWKTLTSKRKRKLNAERGLSFRLTPRNFLLNLLRQKRTQPQSTIIWMKTLDGRQCSLSNRRRT